MAAGAPRHHHADPVHRGCHCRCDHRNTGSYQCYHVFSCPWEAVRLLELTTDREKLREPKRASTSAPTRGVKARAGWAVGFYLGVLTAPFMRAALVIHVDPERAQFPTFRAHQALVVTQLEIGTKSSVWVVPTRRPDELREILRAVPLATPLQPPGFS